MTIAIAFKCKNGVIVATDRRYSYTTSDSSLRDDAEKITQIAFKNGNVLVAEAGDIALTKEFVQEFEKLASSRKIADRYTVEETANEAMKFVKRGYCDSQGVSLKELDEKHNREGVRAQCILAYLYGKETFIHTIKVAIGRVERLSLPHFAIGSGAPLAEYLLKSLFDLKHDEWIASVLGTYIIEIVKKHDFHCGGRPNVWTLFLEGDEAIPTLRVGSVAPNVIDDYVNGISKILDRQQKTIEVHLRKIMKKSFIKRWNRL